MHKHSIATPKAVRHRALHSVRMTICHHRLIAAGCFIAAYYVTAYVLRMENTSHLIEVLGVGPAIDRVYGLLMGEGAE